MVFELKLHKVGGFGGHDLARGSPVSSPMMLTSAPDGVRLTAGTAEFAKSMAAVADLSRRYRNTLRELAKGPDRVD